MDNNDLISLLLRTLEENPDGTYFFKTQAVTPTGSPSANTPNASDINSKLLLSIGEYSGEKRIRIS